MIQVMKELFLKELCCKVLSSLFFIFRGLLQEYVMRLVSEDLFLNFHMA